MLRLTNLANKYQRRTLRVLYGQSQAYPYDAQLDPAFDRTQGALTGANAIAGAKAAILPGLAAVLKAGEVVAPVAAAWATTTTDYRVFGLFANYVGGELTDIPTDFDRVGVWRGVGSVYEILAPAFDDTNLSTETTAMAGTAVTEVYMAPGAKSQLVAQAAGAFVSPNPTARAINRLSANAVVVELLV